MVVHRVAVVLSVVLHIVCVAGAVRKMGATEFTFVRSECKTNTFNDSNSLALLGTLERSSLISRCINGNGVQALPSTALTSPLRSSLSIAPLLPAITASRGMTLEFWLDVAGTSFSDSYLLSVSNTHITSSLCQANLQVYRVANTTEYRLRTCSENGDLISLSLGNVFPRNASSNRTHFAITLTYATTTIHTFIVHTITSSTYINGQVAGSVSNIATTSLLAWNTNRKLHLLSNPLLPLSAFSNELYLFAWHTEALNSTTIWNNYDAGLPNSLPVLWNTTITVYEEGEAIPNSRPSSYYHSSLPLEDLSQLVLPIFDIDASAAIPLLLRLPNRGVLYSDGKIARAGRCNILSQSIYDTFVITAIDGITNLTASEIATISIIVQAVNDPPIPISTSAELMANKYEVIRLSGQDVDSEDVFSVRIVRIPLNGTLHEIFNGSISFTPIMNDTLIRSSTIAYHYSGSQSPNEHGIVGKDSILYTLLDDMHAESVVGKLNINITTSIFAVSDTVLVIEDTKSCFNISGIETTATFPLRIQIMSLPFYGNLTTPIGSVQLHDVISTSTLANTSWAMLCYFTNNYFSVPSVVSPVMRNPEIFKFRMVGRGGETSQVGVMRIEVINNNDPTEIYYNGSQIVESSEFSTVISGFRLADPDLNTDVVLVHISSLKGLIKLNLDYIDKVDFNSFTHCQLKCVGDGYDDREMSFVAKPADAENAINGLIYTSVAIEADDVITITIHDGQNDNCLPEKVFRDSKSIRNTCYTRNVTVPVQVRVTGIGNKSYSDGASIMDLSLRCPTVHISNDFSYMSRMKAIVIGCFVCLVAVLWRCCVSCGRCRRKNQQQLEKEFDLRTQEIIEQYIRSREESV